MIKATMHLLSTANVWSAGGEGSKLLLLLHLGNQMVNALPGHAACHLKRTKGETSIPSWPSSLCHVMLAVSPFRMCCHTHAQTLTFVQSHLEDFCHRWSALLFLFTFTLPWWFLMIWPLRITVWLKSWRRVVLTGATEALGWLESPGFGMWHFLAYAKALCSSSTHWRHSLEPHCKSFDCIVCFTSTLLSTLDSLSALEH